MVVLIMGVLGVLIGAREYGSGLIRTTLSAVPTRLPVLAAKALTFLALALPAMVVAVFGASYAGMAVLDSGGAATLALSDDGVARAVLGTALYLVGTGLMGIALGLITRSIGSGIGLLIALVMVIPGLGQMLLPDSWTGTLDYLPSNAGASFTTLAVSADVLSAGAGAAVFAAWVVGLLVAAGAVLRKRDA